MSSLEGQESTSSTTTSTKSTPSKNTSTNGPVANTPSSAHKSLRAARIEEKQELQELNSRLEFYILKQRERDASQNSLQREIDALRQFAADEVKSVESRFNEQVAELRRSRDSEAKLNARLRNELEKTKEELRLAEGEVERLRENLKTTTDSFHRSLEERDQGVTRAREEARSKSSELAAAEDELESLKKKLEEQVEHYEEQLQSLRSQLDKATLAKASMEDELRKEFTKQLEELLQARQEQYEQEKNEGYESLKRHYDDKLDAYREHLERAGHELEMLKSQLAEAEKRSTNARSSVEELEATKAALHKRIVELEEQLEMEKTRPFRELQAKNEIIRRIKEAFKRKDKEFDDLIDVKIALAVEIKAYRKLLDEEEHRLGYKSPTAVKKRKRTEEDTGERATAPEEETGQPRFDAKDSLLISGMDSEGKYINVRNQSTEEISLGGWKLVSINTKNELAFPSSISLRSGQSITVWTGAEAKQREHMPSDIAWVSPAGPVFDVRGDKVQLISPDNDVIHVVEVIPTDPEIPGSASKDQKEGVPQENKNCLVM